MTLCLGGLALLAVGCVEPRREGQPLAVLAVDVRDAHGGRWAATEAPRRPRLALTLSPREASIEGRVAWLREDPSEALLEDLADPPLRDATRQRLLPFTLERGPGGPLLFPDAPLSPGQRTTLLVWTGAGAGAGDAGDAFFRLPLVVSRSPAAGAALVASLPADGAGAVSTATRRALLQWDGHVEGLAEEGQASLEGPGGEAPLEIRPFDCRAEGFATGSCAWLPLPTLRAGETYGVKLRGGLRAHSGEPVPDVQVRFTVSASTEAPAATVLECFPDEQPVEGGCGRATRDRFLVRLASLSPAWVTLASGDALRSVVATSEPVTLALPLSGPTTLTLRLQDLTGRAATSHPRAWLEPDLAQVRIREVLATPLGTDAHREYVEIMNEGDQIVSLAGWQLAREPAEAGRQVARDARLGPGASALLVGPDFEPAAFESLPEGLARVPLERSLSLSGGGGVLLLRDARGRRVSELRVPHTEPGRCTRTEAGSPAVAGACAHVEVPPS